MSDRGQNTSSSAIPAQDVPDRVPPASPEAPLEPASPEVPLELSASDDGDSPFSLTGRPLTDETEEDDTAGRPRKARTVVLTSLLLVSLAGASTLGWFGWRVNSQRQTTLSTPSTIGAFTLDDSEQATSTADYLQSALSAEIALDKAVGAVYNSADKRSVLFFGGTTLLWSPESDLDSSFDLVADDQGAVSGLKEVDAGDFGGVMKCGVSRSTDGDMTVCGWADHGSIALALFPNRTESEAAPLMRDLRAAIQTR
ncbi:hypothetical protein Aph02nite_94550 [Actinoplanes philippinensis]|uniref:Uncharacterized protein n=1 Tax=Actinoplanes philippinensis TaxID=35752 RepID=A0A1I2NE54_9ACTN|nr:hypothetical protein [Actinoplanes philippinensis]GIE83505.1 hypothetical protein Aph02nite_94550 [Actinoplanes philippinensis]SFG02205.1 hypothetical protein SAMN05421541_1484 [Actinoplanes philippinensis]